MCFIKHIFKQWVLYIVWWVPYIVCQMVEFGYSDSNGLRTQQQWMGENNLFFSAPSDFFETIIWFFANCVNQADILVTLNSLLVVSSCNNCGEFTIITQECTGCTKVTMRTHQLVFCKFLQLFVKCVLRDGGWVAEKMQFDLIKNICQITFKAVECSSEI